MKKTSFFYFALFVIGLTAIGCKKEKEEEPAPSAANTGMFKIGQNYGGGVVFYIDETGMHGLVVDTTNQIGLKAWCAGTPTTTNATSIALGYGDDNSELIVTASGSGNYAASECENLVLNGHDDWFLPSKQELNLLYTQKAAGKINGLDAHFYWSSSETSSTGAWSQSFMNGANSSAHKSGNYGVCPVRAF
jgi:hypothetical protein